MRSAKGYARLKADTMDWKRRHKSQTRFTQYKTYTKHFILHASKDDLHKAIGWFNTAKANFNAKHRGA